MDEVELQLHSHHLFNNEATADLLGWGKNGACNQTQIKLFTDAIETEDDGQSTHREVPKSWLYC